MRLSRANIPLASEDRSHSQAKSHFTHYNLAPQFWPGLINLQHFCHSRWRNPVRLSKSGLIRHQFFSPSKFHPEMPHRSQMILAAPPPSYSENHITIWSHPFSFTIERNACFVG